MIDKPKFICDKGCGKSFTNKKMLQRKFEDGVVKYMLKCSYCGKEYRIMYKNTKIRKLQKQLRDYNLPMDARLEILKTIREEEEQLEARFEIPGSNQ